MKAFALYRELNECGPNETEESISAEVEESSTTDLSYSNESIMRIPERASDIFDQLKKKVLECQANKHEEIHLEKKEARRKPHRRSKTQFQSRAKAQMMIAEKAHENCPSKLSTGKKRALNVCEEEDVAGEQNFDEASITSESINETKSSAKRRHSVKSNKKIVEEPINEVAVRGHSYQAVCLPKFSHLLGAFLNCLSSLTNENRVSIASDTTSDITGQNLTTRTSQLFGQLKANALHRMRSSMKVTGKKIVTGSNSKTKSNHSSRRRSAVHKSKESLKSSVCQR
ncbi:hypothetical protein AB6A40_001476 [Gnathostoma spinigerum]|uniref:Uncharacterized protein n=1 Tax=Gnathostoma spinigerum TaxID=75299 RepID=A0ABD6EE35_9BILA